MAKGSGRQSSTLLGMTPLFIYLFSAAFPQSFKTPIMSDCSLVCQCGAILCAGNVKHTLISLDFVLAASSACLQRWLSPGGAFESLSACPEQQLWWVSPAWQQVKLLLSSLLCASASSEFWLLVGISKRERKTPLLLPHPKQERISQGKNDICGGAVWAVACWARVSFSSCPLGWRSCSANEL